MSVGSTLEAIRYADCVIVLIDATQAFEKQDLTIADMIAREGRAVVFIANKWDLIENRAGAVGDLRDRLDKSLPQVIGAPLVGISALTGEGLDRIVAAIVTADTAWNKRVGTHALNRFLENALERHAPPAVSGRRVRIRYMTQVKARPPTFALFGNQLKSLTDDYVRYLHQRRCARISHLVGTPFHRFLMRTQNPFAEVIPRRCCHGPRMRARKNPDARTMHPEFEAMAIAHPIDRHWSCLNWVARIRGP